MKKEKNYFNQKVNDIKENNNIQKVSQKYKIISNKIGKKYFFYLCIVVNAVAMEQPVMVVRLTSHDVDALVE